VEQSTQSTETIAQALAERDWVLGTIECGVEGLVSYQLFDTETGPGVLGDSLAADTVEEAIDFLGLPWQQFKSSGDFSAKAARAAARAGHDLFEVDLCLAVWAMPLPADRAQVQETVYLALHTGQQTLERTVHYEGAREGMADWLLAEAMGLVAEAFRK
jgi:nicotinamide mononucleotide (NMN) deamidase PncC